MKKVTSVQHAQEITGITPDWEKFKEIGLAPEDVQPAIADQMVKLIVKANNILNNWRPNYANKSQWRYFPWLEIIKKKENSSGLGFSFNVYDYWSTRTYVGARLEVGSAEECRYIAEDFIDLYEMAYLPVK